jgi:hypothetical protein
MPLPRIASVALFSCLEADFAVGRGRPQGNQSDCMYESANFWFSRKACAAIAFQASLRAAIFSVPIRWNSLRSRAEGDAPAAAMRATRWAITSGMATPSSTACAASDLDLRVRRMDKGCSSVGGDCSSEQIANPPLAFGSRPPCQGVKSVRASTMRSSRRRRSCRGARRRRCLVRATGCSARARSAARGDRNA